MHNRLCKRVLDYIAFNYGVFQCIIPGPNGPGDDTVKLDTVYE
ncbi:hypothetical protein GmarT_21890 [Gimesia maris]|uniref:Uncharacterized protein n=1 Tax=Gimesia maris TaxID=122 RepID=A0ABX5YKZ3_9PLAN|nr:hypothetical protein GmarT_21890 [Gimesia maris]